MKHTTTFHYHHCSTSTNTATIKSAHFTQVHCTTSHHINDWTHQFSFQCSLDSQLLAELINLLLVL